MYSFEKELNKKHHGPEQPEPSFKEPLHPADFALGHGYKIKKLESNPDIVIRKYENFRKWDQKIIIEHFSGAKKIFDEMREKYDIHIPTMQFIIGHDKKGDPALYTITERVYGDNLEKIILASFDNKQLMEKLESLYVNLLRYLKENTIQGTDIFYGLGHSQFVYGKRRGEEKDNIYLVDIDPVHASDDTDQNKDIGYLMFFDHIILMILEAEKSLRYNFTKVRMELEKFLDSLPSKKRKQYESTKKFYRF